MSAAENLADLCLERQRRPHSPATKPCVQRGESPCDRTSAPAGVQFRDSLLSGENSTRRWPRCHLFGRDSLGKGSVVCSPGPRSRRGSTGTPGSRRTPHPRTPTSAYLVGSGPRIVPPHGRIPVDPQLTTWRILPPKRIKLREEDSVALPADLGEFVRGFRVRLEAEACLVGRPFD